MDPHYLNRLSAVVQDYVRGVEEAACIEIGIRRDESRAARGPDGRGILACDVDEDGAVLLVPSADYFPDSGVLHEVLHIRRILVEGQPRLSDNTDYNRWNPEISRGLLQLDNALEHLIIVPEQVRICPESRHHWEGVMARVWETDLPAITDAADRRRWALMHWIFLVIAIPDSPVVTTAQEVLRRLGLADDARRFTDIVKPLLNGSKVALVREVFDGLHLPQEMAVLEYIDVRQRESREVPLTEAQH